LKDVSLAADGATATASVTMHNSYEGAELTIDLGRPCVFNHVAVEHGPDEFGFARQVALLTSSDGRNFQEQRRVAGQRKVTNILLVKAALARYIRLRVAVPGNRPWSVAEVVLH